METLSTAASVAEDAARQTLHPERGVTSRQGTSCFAARVLVLLTANLLTASSDRGSTVIRSPLISNLLVLAPPTPRRLTVLETADTPRHCCCSTDRTATALGWTASARDTRYTLRDTRCTPPKVTILAVAIADYHGGVARTIAPVSEGGGGGAIAVGLAEGQGFKKLDEMKKDMQDEHKDTRDTVVGGFEACRQGIAALDERASERDRQFRALLADQRQKEKHESDEKQRKKRLEEEKVVKEIQEMRNKFDEQTAQLTTLVQTLSAVKAPRDSRDSRSSSPPITNLFIGGSGSAASNAIVSRDDIDSSITAVQSPPAVAPRPRRTFLQTPKAIRTPKAKAHLDTFSRALEELDSNATMTSNADVPSRVVKLQHVRNVAPTTTPHTARMEISEDQHVVRALEGRSISRFGRRCEEEPHRNGDGPQGARAAPAKQQGEGPRPEEAGLDRLFAGSLLLRGEPPFLSSWRKRDDGGTSVMLASSFLRERRPGDMPRRAVQRSRIELQSDDKNALQTGEQPRHDPNTKVMPQHIHMSFKSIGISPSGPHSLVKPNVGR
ncbi:hypothetical protein THAOC_09523, partial [Thalassiosira oceanica]